MRYELSQAYTLQPPQCWYHSTQFFVQSQWHQSMHWFECRGMAPNCTEPPRAAAGRRTTGTGRATFFPGNHLKIDTMQVTNYNFRAQ